METHHADYSAFASIYVRVYVKKKKKKKEEEEERKEKKKKRERKKESIIYWIGFIFFFLVFWWNPTPAENKTQPQTKSLRVFLPLMTIFLLLIGIWY